MALKKVVQEKNVKEIIGLVPFSISDEQSKLRLTVLTIREIWNHQMIEWYHYSIQLMEYIHSCYPTARPSLYLRLIANMKLRVLLLLYLNHGDKDKSLILNSVETYYNESIYQDPHTVKAKYNFMTFITGSSNVDATKYLFSNEAIEQNLLLLKNLGKYLNKIERMMS